MNRFFTGNGDDGITGLLGMKRVVKCDLQIETLGTLDELSAALGLARALLDAKTNEDLKGIQRMISRIMSEVAAIPDNVDQFISVNEDAIISLEKMINEYADQIQLPNEFILPGRMYTLQRSNIHRACCCAKSGKKIGGIKDA